MKIFSNSHPKGNSTRQSRLLLTCMLLTILVIAGFQGYWLRDNYNREKQNLDIKTNSAFRQTILRLQASKLQLESVTMRYDSTNSPFDSATPPRPKPNAALKPSV